jgi:DNA-binding GntR family transcriptional regulator
VSLDQPTVLPGAIYDALRSTIISQTDAPGSTITETAVALRFGVARQTAKVAIERLVAEGLLRREVHQAARVPELTRDDIADLYENRAIVEAAAVARLTAIPAAALAAHHALRDSDEEFAQHDIAFHRALVEGQPSHRLARMHALLMGEVELCIGQVQANHLLTASEVAVQHQGILDAIVAGDSGLASRLTSEHIAGSRDRLLAHFDSATKGTTW